MAQPRQRYNQGPAYVQEVLHEVLRTRFDATNHVEEDPAFPGGGPVWLWDPDPATTGIHIQTQYSHANQTTNVCPLLSITTGSMSLVDIGILGDRGPYAGSAWVTGGALLRHYIGIEAGVIVVGQTRAESELLAVTVFEMFLSCRNQMASKFKFHEVSAPVMSPSIPSSFIHDAFETRVALRVVWERDVSTQPYTNWNVEAVSLRVRGYMNDAENADPGETQVGGGTQVTLNISAS